MKYASYNINISRKSRYSDAKQYGARCATMLNAAISIMEAHYQLKKSIIDRRGRHEIKELTLAHPMRDLINPTVGLLCLMPQNYRIYQVNCMMKKRNMI